MLFSHPINNGELAGIAIVFLTVILSILRKVQAKRCEGGCLGRVTWFEAWMVGRYR